MCRILGMLIPITKAISAINFSSDRYTVLVCICQFSPCIPPGLSMDFDINTIPSHGSLPSTLLLICSPVDVVCMATSHFPASTHLPSRRITPPLSPLRSIIPTTKLHDHMHTSHVYDRFLSLYDLRSFDVPCVALFPQPLLSFSRPFTTALVMDMLSLTHDYIHIDTFVNIYISNSSTVFLSDPCSVCFHSSSSCPLHRISTFGSSNDIISFKVA